MSQTKLLLGALLSWGCSFFVGELSAQQAVRRSPAGVSVSSGQAIQPLGQSTRLGVTRKKNTVSDSPYIAVFGAVMTPTVFETTELSVPLQTLIERAGGETLESIGSVQIKEHAATRFKPNQSSKLNPPVARGQVVFVVPRGGRTAQTFDPRKPASGKFVLITGLDARPLLFNVGNQSRTFGQLLLRMRQSEDLLANGQVTGTQTQGAIMDLDSQLTQNSGIHFDPEAVNHRGYQQAVENGFEPEPLVRLEGPRAIAPTSPPVTSNLSPDSEGTGIELAGSSIPFEKPMPFPTGTSHNDEDENKSDAPRQQSHGSLPWMMPKTWQNPESSSPDEVENPVPTINRTSAGKTQRSNPLRTASVEAEDWAPRESLLQREMEPELMANEVPPDVRNVKSSTYAGPQSWFALLVTMGIAVLSVVVSRHIGWKRFSTPKVEAVTTKSAPLTSAPEAAPVPSPEDEQRFLPRLIMNKVPLSEEEPTLPTIDRLHGTAIGGRRLVINDAQESVAGPHVKVQEPRDTRAVELRLRQLMRTGSTSSRQTVAVGATTDPRESHVSKVSPLERALRNVERRDAP